MILVNDNFKFGLKVPREPSTDAQLSDICIGTSAAPTYLPGHYFQNGDREFNLIDGGIVANNPVSNYNIEVRTMSNIHILYQ